MRDCIPDGQVFSAPMCADLQYIAAVIQPEQDR